MKSSAQGYLLEGSSFKSVVVVARPGRYGWSKRLRRDTNCIVARWEGGDHISDGELRWYLDQFVSLGRITKAQRIEFHGAIRRFDENRGGAEDAQSVRTLSKILGMRMVVKASEPPLPKVKPGLYSMTYWQAYRFARFIRRTVTGVDVRMYRVERQARLPLGVKESKSRPGGYAVKISPQGRRT